MILLLVSLRPACTVFRAAALSVLDSSAVQRSPDYVVTHTGKVFDTSAPHEHYRVFLKVMADSGNV